MAELHYDEKALASITLGDVIRSTSTNYPDSRFHPRIFEQTPHYTVAGIDPSPYRFWPTADGVGTKPELAEREYEESIRRGSPAPEVFETLAFDTMAMIESDEARFGRYMVGVANVIDMNSAEDGRVVSALAKGLKSAADLGGFAILNGETAELGYRTSGYGKTHMNWNAVGISVFNPDKIILGKDLKPGQPVIALRESSIRSNGLSKARAILEASYLVDQGLRAKEEYVLRELTKEGVIVGDNDIDGILSSIFGHDALEQVLLPWHQLYPEITTQLRQPSRLYGPAIALAQGPIDKPQDVKLTAAAHISGGGVPEKVRRMVETRGLGVSMDAVFPDPEAVTSLLNIVSNLPEDIQAKLGVSERTASQQWNRGVGFITVAENRHDANRYVELLKEAGYEAAISGKIIDKQEIQWRGETWRY